jgi:hypothetical protein
MVAGLPNQQIAERLGICEDTVKSHVKAVFRKLGARDRAHAVALALGTAAVPGQLLRSVPPLVPAQRRRSGQESPGALRDSLAGRPVPERAGHGGQSRP